jgi:hypothetical protein
MKMPSVCKLQSGDVEEICHAHLNSVPGTRVTSAQVLSSLNHLCRVAKSSDWNVRRAPPQPHTIVEQLSQVL